MLKYLLVASIHGRKVVHGRQEHRDLGHLVQARAARGQDGLEVLQSLDGFVGDGTLYQRAVGVDGDLPRHEEEWACFDGLAVGTDGWETVSARVGEHAARGRRTETCVLGFDLGEARHCRGG